MTTFTPGQVLTAASLNTLAPNTNPQFTGSLTFGNLVGTTPDGEVLLTVNSPLEIVTSEGNSLNLASADSTGIADSGSVNIQSGLGGLSVSGDVSVHTGDITTATFSGTLNLFTGNSSNATTGFTGLVDIVSGHNTGVGPSGNVQLTSGYAAAGDSGDVLLTTGNVAGAGNTVGSIVLTLGTPTSGAAVGNLVLANLPTSDPSVIDAVFVAANNQLLVSGAVSTQHNSVASASAVSLTTGTAANVASVTLPAGKWQVSAIAYFKLAGTTTLTRAAASFTTTTGTLGTSPGQFANVYLAGVTGSAIGQDVSVGAFSDVVTLGSTTTYFLTSQATFATSTCSAYGAIYAVPIAQ